MTQIRDPVEVEEFEMKEEESEFEIDESKERFHDMRLDYMAACALLEDVEDYMDKFYIEFRVGVEAERQKDMEEWIIRKYMVIWERKACYHTMEREDEDGDFKYIRPPGSD